MNLETYLKTVESASSLARRLDIDPSFISQWRTGHRPIPIEQCVPIEQLTNGQVTRRDLRSDWRKIWPELISETEKAAS